jgi:hypothetical protein
MNRPEQNHHERQPSSNVRSLISLALIIHLMMVLVAVSSNFFPSLTQRKLVTAFSPYLQPLNLNLSNNYSLKLYHYTHGEPVHDDHFLEVEFTGGPRSGETVRLPDGQIHGLANCTRYLALARTLAAMQAQGNDEFLNKLTEQGLAPYFLQGEPETQAIVRVRRHAPMSRYAEAARQEAPLDPDAPAYFNTLYEANVTVAADGQVYLTKIEDAGQVAPLREGQDSND